jgi:twitching motility protein PilJ
MNSSSKLFYSSLLSSKNIFNLFLMVLFAGVTLYGIWLLATDQYPAFIGTKIQFTGAVVGAFLITILLTAHLSYVPLDKLQASLDEMEQRSRQNQDAILRLLDEMGDLADGDLTVSATVTENITGAIADSVNFTIDELRNLVTQINTTTLQVASAAQETQATALHLTDASDHQAQQITEVSTAITDMAGSIEQVSQNASQSSDVATQSVNLAAQGNEAVKKAINGMDTIREQIQETSKRMKRLGESSQQIGDIVELINDIAEQTNILSLNAAIQATMAGEAGRGFAVVADEVQRLAERSGSATKQIDALVKTIQSDTNEAISSMERSTTEVVTGAKLSQDAGASLEQIEAVSHRLADLINNISDAAKQQASAAVSTSDNMNVIQEITMQTSTGTNESADSIGRLLELTNELRTSVSGFKLPS